MTLERIAAIGQSAPVRRMADAVPRRPATGFGGALSFGALTAADTTLHANAADAWVRLHGGAGSSGSELSAGDVLLVKVVAVAPQLELAITGADRRPRAAASDSDQPAMRPDQLAWQRQLVSRPPEAVGLATAWRETMLEQIDHQPVAHDGAARQPFGPQFTPLQDRVTALYQPQESGPAPWVLTAYAWGGLRVLLRLLAVEREEPPPAKKRSRTIAIRLALVLEDLGGVVVQLQLGPGGVLLDFAVERAASQQALRDRMPLVIAAVARADLCVARCRVAGGLLGDVPAAGPGVTAAAATSAAALALTRLVQSHRSAAAALPLDLFRAAAEVVLALSTM